MDISDDDDTLHSEEDEDMSHHSITRESVRQYFLENEGKVSNKALVKHFKKALKGSENAENRTTFKAIVDELATVWKDKKGRDYLHLRPEFTESPDSQPSPSADQENQEPGASLPPMTQEPAGATAKEIAAAFEKGAVQASKDDMEASKDSPTETPAEVNVPFSPVTDEASSEEDKMRAGSVLQKARNFDALEEEASSPAKILRSATNEDKCVCATAHLEEETSTSRFSGLRTSHIEMRHSALMTQMSFAPYIKLDEIKRKWMIMSAKCDYQAMTRLLQDHHHLAGWKNFTNGYSALHYAAKFGNTDCIKLLAGKHKANVNSITHAGMTPLHLCALHNQGEAIRLLVETYKADPNIRDYRGKLAKEYLNESRLSRSPINYEVLRLYLSVDGELSRDTVEFLKDNSSIQSQWTGDTLVPRESGTLKHGEGTASGGSNSILRRSFRVGTNRPLAPGELPQTMLSLPEQSQSLGLRKGSYGGTLSEKQKEAMVTRSMSEAGQSLSRPRGTSQRHLRQQNRVASMVAEIPEEPSD